VSTKLILCTITGLLPAILLTGCGGDSGPRRFAVDGTVQVNGQPLPAGVVRFVPEAGVEGPAASAVVKDGKFSLDADTGPVAGQHRIEIEATDYQSFAIDDEAGYAAAKTQSGIQPVLRNPIPANYNSQSTLTETIKEDGPNTFTFKVEAAPATASR
jgi:hypothetical protein